MSCRRVDMALLTSHVFLYSNGCTLIYVYLSLIHCFFWLYTFRVTCVLMLSHFFGGSSTAHFHSLAFSHYLSQPSLCAKMCLSSKGTVRQVLNGRGGCISSLYVSKISVLILPFASEVMCLTYREQQQNNPNPKHKSMISEKNAKKNWVILK